ncbi:MAG: hypothetical protein FWE09_08265, partial [Treponema sp.]|nr:hypothetical protein [Treponema sp.]
QEEEAAEAPIVAAAVAGDGPALRNAVALDIRPDLLFVGFLTDILVDERAVVFGIAPWYARSLTENLSVGGRLGYSVFNVGTWDMQSFSVDASVRYGYRYGFGIMFAEGTLGYANVFIRDSSWETRREAQAHFFKYGGKLGQRFEFGRPGGFMLETALGFALTAGGNLETWSADEVYGLGSMANFMQNYVTRYMLIGGVHLHVSFGYVF